MAACLLSPFYARNVHLTHYLQPWTRCHALPASISSLKCCKMSLTWPIAMDVFDPGEGPKNGGHFEGFVLNLREGPFVFNVFFG